MPEMAGRADALVVGGSIHDRLALRSQLSEDGYRVTITRSVRGGLAQLTRHDFALCALDLSTEERPRQWRRQYKQATAARGIPLYEATTVQVHHP